MTRSKARMGGLCVLVLSGAAAHPARTLAGRGSSEWARSFDVDTRALVTVGENPYFILKPGYQLTLEDRKRGRPGS